MPMSIEKEAKASYLWHVKESINQLIHPCFDWAEVRSFLVWLLCWLLSPILIWLAAYLRKHEAIEQVEQYRLFKEDEAKGINDDRIQV